MNDILLLGISFAGLFHDIGKFAERAYAVEIGDPDMVRQDYRYGHAHNTEQALKILFNEEFLSSTLPNSGNYAECTILNLAARHHRPRYPYEIMISEADRIASSHERAESDDESLFSTVGRERKSQIPLISILGRVHLPSKNVSPQPGNMRYRIAVPPLDNEGDQGIVFPMQPGDYPARQVRADYRDHWSSFVREITSGGGVGGLDPEKQFDTIFELCRMYQWCLPASTRREELEDVSLFEHQKATAALASCLFCYHEEKQLLDENAIRNRKTQKYLLFCGDVCGIQAFIYRISSKGAYKMLKGRSFFIQLLTETLARKYVEELSLTTANILYVSGGKFYLLLPNTKWVPKKLISLSDTINQWLFKRFGGDVYVRTGFETVSGADLTRQSGRTLSQIWDGLSRKLVFEDRRRYAALAREDYDDIFGVGDKTKTDFCKVCYNAMNPKVTGEQQRCRICRTMEEIGRKLGDAAYIVMSSEPTALSEKYQFEALDRYFWFFSADSITDARLQPHKDCLVWCINNTSFADIAKSGSLSTINAAPMIAGSTHRFSEEFEEIAKKSEGIHRLGVLRMDVDDLGKIFGYGLKHYLHSSEKQDTRRFHSLGRITTLSWQLGLFFGTLVPGIIQSHRQWKDRVTVVYAGGDDLFLLGAWDCLPEVALKIRDQFSEFCCNNPSFTISGGMVMTGGKFPIYKSAEMAGKAETEAKKRITVFSQNGKKKKEKDAFTFLNIPMHWKEFFAVSDLKNNLYPLLKEKENRPLLHRLTAIAASWEESREHRLRAGPQQSMKNISRELMAEKWRWRMVYALTRFGQNKQQVIRDMVENLQQLILSPVAGTDRHGIELLGVLSRWCELHLRKPETRQGGE